MPTESRGELAGWGISALLHVVIFLVVAATGLFAAVSSYSHPVDVDIYDLAEAQPQEESNRDPEAEALAPEPEISEVIIPDSTLKEEPRNEEEKKEKQEKKEAREGQKEAPKAAGNPTPEGTPKPVRDASKEKVVAKIPVLLSRGPAVYPESLRAQKAAGSVQVAYVVGADGSVQGPSVSASSGYPELDAAALAAIQTFYYEPGRNGYDEPVAVRGTYTFHFHP